MNCFYNRKKQHKLSITLSILVIYTFFYADFTLLHKVFSQNNIDIVKQDQINEKKI